MNEGYYLVVVFLESVIQSSHSVFYKLYILIYMKVQKA
jgi:hypothetical protein